MQTSSTQTQKYSAHGLKYENNPMPLTCRLTEHQEEDFKRFEGSCNYFYRHNLEAVGEYYRPDWMLAT